MCGAPVSGPGSACIGAPPDLVEEPDPLRPSSRTGCRARSRICLATRAARSSSGCSFPEPWAGHRASKPASCWTNSSSRDRPDRTRAACPWCRPPLRALVDDGARYRLGVGLHDRCRDRRDRPLRLTQEAGRPSPVASVSAAERDAVQDVALACLDLTQVVRGHHLAQDHEAADDDGRARRLEARHALPLGEWQR